MKLFPWDRPLTNFDIQNVIDWTPLRTFFRGTFSRDELSRLKPKKGREAGIINLSKSFQRGTHWVAWTKKSSHIMRYFDSFGDLPPPPEFIQYASRYDIEYNVERAQNFETVICGQLCLCFLIDEFCR